MKRTLIICGMILGAALMACAGPKADSANAVLENPPAATELNPAWMLEGQKRYATNCGRCHQAPHKFSPREMAMAVRHMRVRAMLTQDDMKYVMYYMTH